MSKDIPKSAPKAQAKGPKGIPAKDGSDSLDLKVLQEKFDPTDKAAAKAKTPEEIEEEKKNPKKQEDSDKIEQFTPEGWTESKPKETDSLQFRTPKYPENKEVIKDQNIKQLKGNEWKDVDKTEKK